MRIVSGLLVWVIVLSAYSRAALAQPFDDTYEMRFSGPSEPNAIDLWLFDRYYAGIGPNRLPGWDFYQPYENAEDFYWCEWRTEHIVDDCVDNYTFAGSAMCAAAGAITGASINQFKVVYVAPGVLAGTVSALVLGGVAIVGTYCGLATAEARTFCRTTLRTKLIKNCLGYE